MQFKYVNHKLMPKDFFLRESLSKQLVSYKSAETRKLFLLTRSQQIRHSLKQLYDTHTHTAPKL